MITSTSTIKTAAVGRTPGEVGGAKHPPRGAQVSSYAGDTELAKLIRYGCQFELQVHQMAELSQMRAENIELRRRVQDGAEVPAVGNRRR